jgi:hypothetical protein
VILIRNYKKVGMQEIAHHLFCKLNYFRQGLTWKIQTTSISTETIEYNELKHKSGRSQKLTPAK